MAPSEGGLEWNGWKQGMLRKYRKLGYPHMLDVKPIRQWVVQTIPTLTRYKKYTSFLWVCQ